MEAKGVDPSQLAGLPHGLGLIILLPGIGAAHAGEARNLGALEEEVVGLLPLGLFLEPPDGRIRERDVPGLRSLPLVIADPDRLGLGVEVSHLEATQRAITAAREERGRDQVLEVGRTGRQEFLLLLGGEEPEALAGDVLEGLHIPPGCRTAMSTVLGRQREGSLQDGKNAVRRALSGPELILGGSFVPLLSILAEGLPGLHGGRGRQVEVPLLNSLSSELVDLEVAQLGPNPALYI